MLGSQKKIVKVALLLTSKMTGRFPHKHSEKNAKKHTHTHREDNKLYVQKKTNLT